MSSLCDLDPKLAQVIKTFVETNKPKFLGVSVWVEGQHCEAYVRVARVFTPYGPELMQAVVLANVVSRAPGHGKAVFDFLRAQAEEHGLVFKVENAMHPKMVGYCEAAGMKAERGLITPCYYLKWEKLV